MSDETKAKKLTRTVCLQAIDELQQTLAVMQKQILAVQNALLVFTVEENKHKISPQHAARITGLEYAMEED